MRRLEVSYVDEPLRAATANSRRAASWGRLEGRTSQDIPDMAFLNSP
jgi:hypothetical protein